MNTPKLWRELTEGMGPAPDIEAVQRMLWRLLGDDSTNARNGRYGDQTTADVQRARSLLGLSDAGPATSVGATMFAALYPYGDTRARVLFAPKPTNGLEPTPTCVRPPLTKGMQGSDVKAAQRALWRALQGDSSNARNGTFGDQTEADIGRYRRAFSFNESDADSKIGQQLWDSLTRWFDQTAVDLAHAQPHPKPPPAESEDDLRAAIVSQLRWAYDNRDRYLYAQVRPMPASLKDPPTLRTDCSGYATLGYKDAGAPNPNRSDGVYDGAGYTGTLEAVGVWVSAPKPGDFAMYDGHVAVMDESAAGVYSFGHDPIEHYSSPWYRDDFRGYLRSPHFPA